jgi:AAA domain
LLESANSPAARRPLEKDNRRVAECVILIGLPGAGKTRFYDDYFAATHAHVSKDRLPNARGRDERQRRIIEENLRAGASIVVDNTNPAIAERSGRARVPDVAIFAIARRLEPPVLAEGFDQLFEIRLTPERTFSVREIVEAGVNY